MSPSGREGRHRDDRRRRRDRDHDDRYYDRRRDRDNRDRDEDRSQPNASIQRPVILLKRPGAGIAASSSSQPQLATQSQNTNKDRERGAAGDDHDHKSHKQASMPSPAPPIILQRSNLSKRTAGSIPDLHQSQNQDAPTEKPKPVCPPSINDILKPPYKFPHESATSLIDKHMKMKPINAFDFFNNGRLITDFFVITAVGRPLAGKSAILSHLITKNEEFGTTKMFGKRSRNEEMESFMYITSDNIIFIEMASLFNCAAAHDLASQQGTLETMALTWNMRLMRWALAVSHIVLVVSDNLIDPNLLQLINSAEMIHSMESALGEGAYPELVFVCNKAPLSYLDDSNMQSQIQLMLDTATGRSPRIHPNFYILPHKKLDADFFRYDELKKKIYDYNRYNRAPFIPEIDNIPKVPQKYSAFEWYHNVTRIWEDMIPSNYFASYVKLLP